MRRLVGGTVILALIAMLLLVALDEIGFYDMGQFVGGGIVGALLAVLWVRYGDFTFPSRRSGRQAPPMMYRGGPVYGGRVQRGVPRIPGVIQAPPVAGPEEVRMPPRGNGIGGGYDRPGYPPRRDAPPQRPSREQQGWRDYDDLPLPPARPGSNGGPQTPGPSGPRLVRRDGRS